MRPRSASRPRPRSLPSIHLLPRIKGRDLGPLALAAYPSDLETAHRLAAAYADEEIASGDPASRAGIQRVAFLTLAAATKDATEVDLHRADVVRRLRA